MRNLFTICLLFVGAVLPALAEDQLPVRSQLEGAVTLMDTNRGLLVLQERGQARAVNWNGPLPDLRPGDRVVLEGKATPYFPSFPDFPQNPSGSEILRAFEAPPDVGDHFLARLRGFLQVPTDGSYTFWLTADDEAEIWLSSSAEASRARLVAAVRSASRQEEWERDTGQKSKPISLKAGERYYIEALQREWRGHDHLSVAWQGPGFGRRIIGGEFLSPGSFAPGVTIGLLREYWTNCFITRLAVLSPKSQDSALLGISAARVVSRQSGELPSPQRVSLERPCPDGRDFIYVEVEGVADFVTTDQGRLTLELVTAKNRREDSDARLTVRILEAGDYPTESLINRKVRVVGVCERTVNEAGEQTGAVVWVQNAGQLIPLDFSDRDARELEPVPMFDLTPANLNLAWGRKILVRGAVIKQEPGTGRVTLRGDDSFCAYMSNDSKTWSPVGVPVPVAMDDAIYAGLAASSVTVTGGMVAVFSDIYPPLTNARSAGLAKDDAGGKVVITNGQIRLQPVAGNDWTTTDKGLFYYQPFVDEGDLVVGMQSFWDTRISDKAGMMMRESLKPDSPYVALVMTHSNRLDLLYRSSARAPSKAVDRVPCSLPLWLKITRRQHTLTAQFLPGEKVRPRQHLELIGRLEWQNGEPILQDAYVRSTSRLEQTVPAVADTRESRIADLPAATAESEQYLGENYLIRGVVTFIGRAFGRELLFLQDDSGAATIRAAPVFFRSGDVEPGQILEAKGDVQFSPGIPPFRLNTGSVLGKGQLPEPLPYPGRASARQADNHWVELKGIVRSVTNNLLTVMERNGPVSVWVGGDAGAAILARYVDCLVTIRGVFTTQILPKPVVLTPSTRQVQVDESPPDDPFVLPSFPINKVFAPESDLGKLHRAKITGVVTYRDEASLILQDQTGGARVVGGNPGKIRVGDRVEAVGFPSKEGETVTLDQPILRPIGEGQTPAPIEMLMDGLLDSHLNCWLVQVQGVVLDQRTRDGRQRLELQNGQRVFEAVLAKDAGQLSPLPAGSRVKVTGVTQLQVAGQVTASGMGRNYPVVVTMEILMRSPADLVLIERPPWWTWRHTAFVGAVLLAIIVGAFGWIHALRRRVAKRTRELQVTMSRLKQETEFSATLAERERLAAEIHDTLEQGLSGIMMQLDGVDSRMAGDQPGARENLEMARRMVRFSRAEVRHSLWNLESQLLKDGDLGAAIKEIARQMSAGSATKVAVEVSDANWPLPAAVDHHLLRCTQEAVSNALKHSGAQNIRVKLNYGADQVVLTVTDDGCGFDATQVMTHAGTHLGMRNLRSRARKMKGQLTITSQPGQGTTISLAVPLNVRAGKNSPVGQ